MILAAMALAPNFYCKNCLLLVSAMRENPPLGEVKLSPILCCTGAINWMLDEIKSNKYFIGR